MVAMQVSISYPCTILESITSTPRAEYEIWTVGHPAIYIAAGVTIPMF